MDNIKLENWMPMPPNEGPPLPEWMGIYWPWYKPPTVPTVYTCPVCGATFSTQEALNQHIATVHPTGAYGCPYCDQSFNTLKELIDHVAAAHPDKPPLQEIEIIWT